jgi:hypothetical protein
VAFENVLPRLRTPAIARAAPEVFHIVAPGEPDDATPMIAFTCDGVLLSRADIATSKIKDDALLRAAVANLAKQRGSWRVETLAGGFMGLGKKSTQVMSLVHEHAAEHILLDGFLDEVERMMPKATFFVPRRGTLRCVAPAFVEKERSKARRAFRTAGNEAVCPVELHRSPIIGQLFALGARYCETDYATPGPLPVVRA